MICKIKARRSKSVDLSRSKHHWSKSMIKLFQSLGTGAVPVWCSKRDPDSNSTVCKTAGIAPSQVRILSGSIRGVVSELVKGGGPINGSRLSDRIPVFRNTLGAVSNGKPENDDAHSR